jgi:hypothetical protein
MEGVIMELKKQQRKDTDVVGFAKNADKKSDRKSSM